MQFFKPKSKAKPKEAPETALSWFSLVLLLKDGSKENYTLAETDAEAAKKLLLALAYASPLEKYSNAKICRCRAVWYPNSGDLESDECKAAYRDNLFKRLDYMKAIKGNKND